MTCLWIPHCWTGLQSRFLGHIIPPDKVKGGLGGGVLNPEFHQEVASRRGREPLAEVSLSHWLSPDLKGRQWCNERFPPKWQKKEKETSFLFDSRRSWQNLCITHIGITLRWWLVGSRASQWSGGCVQDCEITTGLGIQLSFCGCYVFLAPVPHLLADGLCENLCWLWVWDTLRGRGVCGAEAGRTGQHKASPSCQRPYGHL